MKLRVAKKILKKKDELSYKGGQIQKAKTVAARRERRAAKKA